MPVEKTELTVRSESVQSLYSGYLKGRFNVNRRYQRKLVWTVSEKQNLIDSIYKDLPIPLFLMAELSGGVEGTLEVIDGMQRLNAIFSFLENEYPLNGKYFNLSSLADTLERRDSGVLTQKEPAMDRSEASHIANYDIALSVFRASDNKSIDEVFRRINSGGRRLSSQELRQAGTLSPLGDAVRVISSQLRGDTSPGDIVPLQKMPQLSITNRDLEYGVDVESIFWVRHGILRREDVRVSQDEQLVLDIIIDCTISPIPTISKAVRDSYYDFTVDSSGAIAQSIEGAIASYANGGGVDALTNEILYVYDFIRAQFDNEKFSTVIGVPSGGRAPRYFHAVFIAIYQLMVQENLRLANEASLTVLLRNASQNSLSLPGGSGTWTSEDRQRTVNLVKGVLRPKFVDAPSDEHDALTRTTGTQMETILSNAVVEQQMFECKQGFCGLGVDRRFEESVLDKILRTASAMANMGRSQPGHIIVGIADRKEHADLIERIDSVSSLPYRGFHVVGIGREAALQEMDLGIYWDSIIRKIGTAPGLDDSLRINLVRDASLVNYRGLTLAVFSVSPVSSPVFFNAKLYERHGSETKEVPTEGFGRLFGRFV